MRKLVSLIVAVGLAAVFAGPTFAADAPKTQGRMRKGQYEVAHAHPEVHAAKVGAVP